MRRRILPLVSLLLTSIPLVARGEQFAVLEGTESPDRHYAVGWGMKQVNDIAQADPVNGDPDAVENYVIDMLERKIISPLHSAYWVFNSMHPNHRDFEVIWSGDSSMVVALYTLRWGDLGSFEAVCLDDGRAVASLDLAKVVEPQFRLFLSRSWPAYARLRNSIDALYGGLKVEREGILSVTIMGGIPGDKSGESFSEEATVQFSLTKEGADKLKGEVVSISKMRPEMPTVTPTPTVIERPEPIATPKATPTATATATPTPTATEDPASKADKRLNAAYKALREKLDPSGREILKAEQRAWLLERDKITDRAKKLEFIEKRITELESRAKGL